MKNKKIILSALVIILLAAAAVFWISNMNVQYMKTEVASSNGSNYELMLPEGMEPAQLNDNASLQYADEKNNLYVIVIDESKEKIVSFGLDYDLDTYMKIASRTLDSAGVFVNKSITINDTKALQTDIGVARKSGNMSYILTCLETKTYFYQLLVWTTTGRLEQNKEKMIHIINTFKETQKKP
ncbi:MAG: hypothetical protein Fur0041_01970 [Bacteroidia bacterium]